MEISHLARILALNVAKDAVLAEAAPLFTDLVFKFACKALQVANVTRLRLRVRL